MDILLYFLEGKGIETNFENFLNIKITFDFNGFSQKTFIHQISIH